MKIKKNHLDSSNINRNLAKIHVNLLKIQVNLYFLKKGEM